MPLTTCSWRALGTSVHVLVTEPEHADLAVSVVAAVLDEIDLRLSPFRSDSELSRLNSRAGERVTVSPLLAQAIDVSLQAARLTGGAVDPTVGSSMRLLGYDDDFSRVRSTGAPLRLRVAAVPGWRAVHLDSSHQTVLLERGVELDLGSTGKALAADLAAEGAHLAMGRGGVLVSLGGDIATAGSAPLGGWHILAAEDSDMSADAAGEVIGVEGGAIATSSTTVRRWRRGGVVLHHLIDPKTGLPARSPWRTATVLAPSCVAANTIATAAIVLGERALDWLSDFELPVRLVAASGAVHRLGGWPMPLGAAA